MSESDLFVLYYLTVLVYTKTILHFSIGGLGKIFPFLLLGWVNIHLKPPPLWSILVNCHIPQKVLHVLLLENVMKKSLCEGFVRAGTSSVQDKQNGKKARG